MHIVCQFAFWLPFTSLPAYLWPGPNLLSPVAYRSEPPAANAQRHNAASYPHFSCVGFPDQH